PDAAAGAKGGGTATRPTRNPGSGAASAASRPAGAASSSSSQAASRPVSSSPTRDRRALFLGDGTHLLGQLKEGKIIFMQVFQVVNRGQAPVDPGPKGIMLPLPLGVSGAAVAGDDKTLATISKDRKSLRLTRVLPPGRTTIRVNFAMSTDGARLDFRQRMGLALGGSLFAVTNNNALAVHGPVFDRREMRGETPVFLLKAVPAGGFLEFTIDAIPFHDPLWRNLTVGGALLLVLWTLVAGIGAGIRRRRWEGRREELLDSLVDLNARRASGEIKKKRYDQDRKRIIDELRPLWDV
ncbi:MAG: hypothetical protein KAI47_24830, partial [Deltaproteobacteria bacterium]|nr:hypothetical protein [Deltaproteobacteria bacterium]